MNNLKELEKKYEELGKEIERLKKEQETVGFKNDSIFLLSKEEYERYKDKIPKITCWWWTRSGGNGSCSVAFVDCDDSGYYKGGICASLDSGAVRPALKISDYYAHSGKIVFNGVTWVRIDKDLYISELPIDFRRFDSTSNNYETSEVRKFLLYWFEERRELN